MNRLSKASSPYLLQHSENPVEWNPWGAEAFEQARREQKPIFLSIGYSTCHWCHVMAHESFEDPEIARLMNENFVNVKVDREERPDVDRLYMTYVQSLGTGGGWPMSVWLTPELKPFFGGTYFPPEDRHGRVGFPSVLNQIAQVWRENRDNVEKEAVRALSALRDVIQTDTRIDSAPLDSLSRGVEYFRRIHDERWGGFGSAPKFPRPSVLFFLLREAGVISKNDKLIGETVESMVLKTLGRMASGGIHDHLGGGFHRYSVDRKWHVPHFEKMLYDQAQLAIAYTEAWQLTGDERHAVIARKTLSYVQREMTSPEGAFYSAEDADSLHGPDDPDQAEGAFYVWTKQEIESALEAEDSRIFCRHFGILREGNVDPATDPHGELLGKNVLMEQGTVAETAAEEGLSEDTALESLDKSRRILFGIRSQRPRPHLDDKIICAWNGLMISAFARAGAVFADSSFLASAEKAAEFALHYLTHPETGELRRSWRGGRVVEHGFAEDYAFLIQGLLDLYEATLSIHWLKRATELQVVMDRLFRDESLGGYFSSASGDPHLLVRQKEEYDGAEPSANSVAALNLMRFSRMLGDERAAKKAEEIFSLSKRTLMEMPAAIPQLLVAIRYSQHTGRQIVVAGDPCAADTNELLKAARKGYHPAQVLLLADGRDGQAWLAEHVPSFKDIKPFEGRACIYICENFICAAPVTEFPS